MTAFKSAYIRTLEDGSLQHKVDEALGMLSCCRMCPRSCGVDRNAGEKGFCTTGAEAEISSCFPHFGEEAPLVGNKGSGTIFVTHCNLLCKFCQNFEISHGGQGTSVSAQDMAKIMLELQTMGCHNINFVTPSHVVPQILQAVLIAAQGGLTVPLVYNSGGYDRVETLRLLAGVFDIYMPDFKFWDPSVAHSLCDAEDYPEVARNAIAEMHRQVGDLQIDERGVAQRGLLVRHLVLPEGLAGTREIARFLAGKISADTYVNVMSQYHPCGTIDESGKLNRRTTRKEYDAAVRIAGEEGLRRLDLPRRVFLFK